MKNLLFKHTSRSFFDIYNPLVKAYPSKPTWLFEEYAGAYEVMSELLNVIANDILNPITRESAYAFADRLDYIPVESDGCTTEITIKLKQAMNKKLKPRYQVGGISSSTGDMVIFETTADAESNGTDTILVSVKQKKTYTDIVIGMVQTDSDYMEFPIDGYSNILRDSISLQIDDQVWTRVDNFDASTQTDMHFIIIYQSSGKSRIVFGNGENGQKPNMGNTIYASFAVTKGLLGRMGAGEININVGGDSDIMGVKNSTETSGGNDAESIASIIRNARANVRLRKIVWSKEDLETSAVSASSNVVKAHGIPGLGAAVIHIVPAGGGMPSSALLGEVDNYVTALTQFGVMPVEVSAPNYKKVNISAHITVRFGYNPDMVKNLVTFALTLVTCAFDSQVIDYYKDYGIDACREKVINTIWSWAFTQKENDALEFIIEQWIKLLDKREYREWGQPLEVGDLWIVGNNLYDFGVDIFELIEPVLNQGVTEDQIIDAGIVVVT